LKQIESYAFPSRSLQWNEAPETIRSLWTVVNQSSKGVFKIERALLIDMREHALVRIVSCGADIVIPRHIQTLGCMCFQHCDFNFWITFAADSELTRIESFAFERLNIDSIAIH
jgi:hypothetical protein